MSADHIKQLGMQTARKKKKELFKNVFISPASLGYFTTVVHLKMQNSPCNSAPLLPRGFLPTAIHL